MSHRSSRTRHKRHVTKRRDIRSIRKVVFGMIVVIVLGLAVYLLSSSLESKTPPPAENTIDISASMGGFDKDVIRVKAGKSITIRLTSQDNEFHMDGGGKHQWAVDELDLSVIAPPKGSEWVTFTPDKPGKYTFYCDICCGGRANPTMQGTLIVEA